MPASLYFEKTASGVVPYTIIVLGSMIFGALVVFIPQMAIAMFTKKGGIGGADIKLSTAAAMSLGFYGGAIGYMIGLVLAIVFQTIYNKVKKQSNKEAFPLLPFLSTGLMKGEIEGLRPNDDFPQQAVLHATYGKQNKRYACDPDGMVNEQ